MDDVHGPRLKDSAQKIIGANSGRKMTSGSRGLIPPKSGRQLTVDPFSIRVRIRLSRSLHERSQLRTPAVEVH